ncbi:MAG: hypothetical protein AAF296_00635 [Pseudomonadota bacterium]
MVVKALGAVALVMTLVLPATASQKRDPMDVLGTWTFQTKPYREGQCVMSGTMHLTDHPEKGRYNCELTAVEVCSMWGRSIVLQSCDARRFDDQVSIRSSIAQILEKKTENLIYIPDNFSLTVQDHSRMWGALISAATAPVEFRRAEEGMS